MKSRGQAAMEYMTTYGWAVLVVAIAGVVLWQLGVFDFQSKLAPGYSGFSVLVPLEWVANEAGGTCTLQLVLMNGAGEELNSVAIGGDSCDPANLSTGGRTTCSMNMGACSSPGKPYETELVITYLRSYDNMSFQTAGALWGNTE